MSTTNVARRRQDKEDGIARSLDHKIAQGIIQSYERPNGIDVLFWRIVPRKAAPYGLGSLTTAEAHAFVLGMRLMEIHNDQVAAELKRKEVAQ